MSEWKKMEDLLKHLEGFPQRGGSFIEIYAMIKFLAHRLHFLETIQDKLMASGFNFGPSPEDP